MNSPLAAIDKLRNHGKQLMTLIARGLNKATGGRLSPTAITLVGFSMHGVIAWLITRQHLVVAGLLLIFFGLFDALDGALARLQDRASTKGMFLDSVTDRMKEVLLYPAIGYVLLATDHPYGAVWAVAACGASLLVSYTNAWGEVALRDRAGHAQNKAFRTGLMTFDVRMLVVIIGLLANQLYPATIIVTVGAAITAVGRLNFVLSKLD